MRLAVLISIQPKWCELIANGEKTVEVRKTKPKIKTPFKCYIYCTKGKNEALWKYFGRYYYDTQYPNERPNKANGKVIGEFVCDIVEQITDYSPDHYFARLGTCMKPSEMWEYGRKNHWRKKPLYALHISDLVIYDKPKELSEFKRFCDGVSGNIGCRGCEYYYTESNESIGFYEKCGCDNLRPLTRSPQSWCYVEVME